MILTFSWVLFPLFSSCRFLNCRDGGSVQWAVPGVSSPEVNLHETGSAVTRAHNSFAETERCSQTTKCISKTVCMWCQMWCMYNSLSAGATVPNGETGDLTHKPVQCTQEIPTSHHEKPPTLTAAAHGPAAQCGIGHLSRNMGAFSDLLAEDMSKLQVDGLHWSHEKREPEQNKTPMQSQDFSKWQTASFSVTKNLGSLGGDKTMHTVRVGIPTTHMSQPCLWMRFESFFTFFSDACDRLSPPGRGLSESLWLWHAGVGGGSSVSHLWVLSGGFPWKHDHQRRVSAAPLHTRHLDRGVDYESRAKCPPQQRRLKKWPTCTLQRCSPLICPKVF